MEFDRKDENEQEAQPKDGHRNAEKSPEHAGGVEEGVRPHGGDDPSEKADGRGHQDADQGKLQGEGQALKEQLPDWVARLDGDPEIPAYDVPDEAQVLNYQRLVQPILSSDALDVFLGGLLPPQDLGGVAGYQVQEREGDQGHAKEDGDEHEDPAEDVSSHAGSGIPEETRGRADPPAQGSGRPPVSGLGIRSGYFSFQVSLSTYTSSSGELMTSWSFKDMPTVSLVARR